MQPLIGIATSFRYESPPCHAVGDDYVRAVAQAGGVPVLVPCLGELSWVDRFLSLLDGLLLTGGPDLDPVYYGQLPGPGLGPVVPERDGWELALARGALREGLPVLAICRGIQVLNVAAGGTLVQDIPREVPRPLQHMQKAPRWYPTHPVDIAAGSMLAQVLGCTRARVNSFHHQAVGQVAPGFTAVAVAPDGVIEAVELRHPAQFALGVQWHPENMWEREPLWLALFRALVEAAEEFRSRRGAGRLERNAGPSWAAGPSRDAGGPQGQEGTA